MILKKIIKLKDNIGIFESGDMYGNKEGYYLLLNKREIDYYFVCREEVEEEFHYHYEKTRGLAFHLEKIDIINIDRFFNYIYKAAKIPGPPIKFSLTNLDDVIHIEIPKFWQENRVIFSLFTLFLRCAAIYYKGDFNKAIINYKLASKIKKTISYFMKGNIYFNLTLSPIFGDESYVTDVFNNDFVIGLPSSVFSSPS